MAGGGGGRGGGGGGGRGGRPRLPAVAGACAGRGRRGTAREFADWKRSNVVPQKQEGFVAVQVTLPLGDVAAARLHALAKTATLYADGFVRATPAQNIVLRWVRAEN